ncbi:MAG: PIN domain-containing protein [Candidatus Aenigmarchaeota archaeon]|nr:PIN domain-containing protein [Candidatus Aenigmarchaeota archaeon]
MTDQIFFDTYAFFEVIRGNPDYEKYIKTEIVTTIFNLVELNFTLKREKGKTTADEYLDKYAAFAAPILMGDIKNATDMRLKFKNMSFPDVIGFVVAKRLGIRFLTGDPDFEGMENVEFVK